MDRSRDPQLSWPSCTCDDPEVQILYVYRAGYKKTQAGLGWGG